MKCENKLEDFTEKIQTVFLQICSIRKQINTLN